jgi:hypothetical protein
VSLADFSMSSRVCWTACCHYF